jgi:hypothetical protein
MFVAEHIHKCEGSLGTTGGTTDAVLRIDSSKCFRADGEANQVE